MATGPTVASPLLHPRVEPLADPRALYLHVPFCPQVCPYCDFHKMRRAAGLVEAYVARIVDEAASTAARWPGPLDTARWRAQGITRVSIGLQSTQDGVLRFLGRGHRGADGLQAIADARAAGLEVSADVITAVPVQDAERDLRAVAAAGADHVSVYTLTIEAHTPFARRGVAVDDDRAADDFDLAEAVLAEHGFERYEVSNHARPGHRSRHNPVYWHGEACLALGPGAAGLLPPESVDPAGTVAVRTMNPPIKAWLRGDPPERTPLSGRDFVLEKLMTGLRTVDGVDLGELRATTGIDVAATFPDALGTALRHGLLVLDGPRLRATRAGVRVLNAVLRGFFSEG